jgi:uncharacterized membrane protein YfcA
MGPTLLLDGQPVPLLGLLALGSIVGFIAGVFGVGGGFLLTPMLTALFHVPTGIAVGSGLCQMIGTATVTFLRRRRDNLGEPRVDLFLLGGSLLGVDAGARLLAALTSAGTISFLGKPRPLVVLVAEGLFAALLLAISALFWWQGGSSSSDPEAPRPGPLARLPLPLPVSLPAVGLRVSAFALAYTGLFLGLMSGLLGVGGGVLLLPLLIHGYGFSIRAATGTGILVLLTSSCVGTFLHALRGNVRLEVVLPLLVASSLSAQIGARVARGLHPRTMRRGFALLCLATVAILVSHLLR